VECLEVGQDTYEHRHDGERDERHRGQDTSDSGGRWLLADLAAKVRDLQANVRQQRFHALHSRVSSIRALLVGIHPVVENLAHRLMMGISCNAGKARVCGGERPAAIAAVKGADPMPGARRLLNPCAGYAAGPLAH
jgi:hypothetical protein